MEDRRETTAQLFARAREAADEGQRRAIEDEIVRINMVVAHDCARRYRGRGIQAEDLDQVAYLGLVKAVQAFDDERGHDFLSFAVPTINGEVRRYFRDRTTAIRTPRRLRALQAGIYTAADELAQRHGRAPRPSEIAAHLEVDVAIVLEALAARGVAHTDSLDEQAQGDDGSEKRLRFDAALAHVEEEFDLVEHREALTPLLDALPERERLILLLRFFGGKTQTEIGAQLGISQMHVSRLLSRTLGRLRRQLAVD
jgi:RNA polymerase sigma-B factor